MKSGEKGENSFRKENSQDLCNIFEEKFMLLSLLQKPSIWHGGTPGLPS